MAAAALTVRVGARRWVNRGATLAAGAAVIGLAGLAVSMVLGYRPLVVRSGSMEPEIGAGDVVLSKLVAPDAIEPGDVVTFRDPSRQDRLITHRVVGVKSRSGRFSFVTKGDANTGVERWDVTADGTVGRVGTSVPKLGYIVSSLGTPLARAGLLAAAAVILAGIALRRIWSG